MAFAHDLLSQADHLLRLEKRRPKQASLRRAVSTAYYACFHLLIEEASHRLSPGSSVQLRNQIGRAFAHGEMKEMCQAVQRSTGAFALSGLQPSGFSSLLKLVATNFVLLQESRHTADYNMAVSLIRIDVEKSLDQARELFQAWEQVRPTDEANIFCAALLLGKRWGR